MDNIHIPALYNQESRDGRLIQILLDETASAGSLLFYTPLPRDPLLSEKCISFMQQPNIHFSVEC